MKRASTFTLLTVVFMIASLAGCERADNSVGPTSSPTGNLAGNVSLMQQDRAFMANDGGVQVSIQGTSLATTTDNSGYFKFTALKAGTYNIMFRKSGFGTAELESYQFIPNDTNSSNVFKTLFQIPSYYVSRLTSVVSDTDVDIHGALTDSSTYQRLVLIFVGNDSSTADYDHSAFQIFAEVPSDSSQFYGSVSAQMLHSFGFQTGSVAYLAARTYVGLSTYTDSTGKEIYTSFNPNIARTRVSVP